RRQEVDRGGAVTDGGGAALAKVSSKSRGNCCVPDHRGRLDRNTRQILVHHADLSPPPRQGIVPVDLDLGLPLPGVRLVALIQPGLGEGRSLKRTDVGLWIVDHETAIPHCLAATQTTCDSTTVPETGAHLDLEAVIDLRRAAASEVI